MRAFLYNLSRHHLSGMPLSRWLFVLLLLGGAITALGWIGGGWIATAIWLLAALALLAVLQYLQRTHFVAFAERPAPALEPKPLAASDKIPIHASGHFHVEGKYRHFAWIQGFFRTFATREHATLCLVSPSRFLGLAVWPEEETGMWYCFLMPDHIQQIRWGEIRFSGRPTTGLAIDYHLTMPKRHRFGRQRTVDETLYLACRNEEDAQLILADLLYDQAGQSQSSNGTGHNA